MSLNVVGLISGGKDSLYSLAHCVQNGHKLVALANLYPHIQRDADTVGEGSDLDSFMYQTVGHTIIPLYAEALGIPLYRRAIRGTACQTGRYYDTSTTTTEADETEDMYMLIQDVLKHHPEANALNAGAILSTYQRSRVESVAIRLRLTPLAYLWQYPALPAPGSRDDSLTGLLDDMAAAQCDARIIKIASGGVRKNLLCTNVAASMTATRLVSGLAPFFAGSGQEFPLRGAVLGEGGEYETLALGGPGLLWKKTIEVEFVDSFDAEGGTTYATFGHAMTVDRDEFEHIDVPVPYLLDKHFVAVQSRLYTISPIPSISKHINRSMVSPASIMMSSFHLSSSTLQMFNITSSKPGLTPAQQLENIIDTIQPSVDGHCHVLNLPAHSFTFRNIISTILLLGTIDDFASINQIYATKLWPQGFPNPPSRVTVAAALPEGIDVSLSLVMDLNNTGAESRNGLHVQSRSYWAPANIGPYSQAISTPVLLPQKRASLSLDQTERADRRSPTEVVHMAGQIPLVPASMAMLHRPFHEQAVLALQHLWRVGQERGVDLWAGAGVAYLASTGSSPLSEDKDAVMLDKAHQAARLWRIAHQVDEKGIYRGDQGTLEEFETREAGMGEEDEDIDIWDLQQRNRGFGASDGVYTTIGEHLHSLPSRDLCGFPGEGQLSGAIRVATRDEALIAPFIAAEVSGLPRNAPIEWWSTGIAGLTAHGGQQQCKVWPISRATSDVTYLSGIAMEHVDQDAPESNDTSAGTARASRGPSSFTFFVTLTVKMNSENLGKEDVPGTIGDLKTILFEDGSSRTCEVATAHSFLNLSCSTGTRHLLEDIHLVRQATVVPCYHVWASRTVMVDDEAIQAQRDEVVEEVAAAIILRIEAFSQ